MTTIVVEEMFDHFANDYYQFLALRYNIKPNYRIKVVHSTNQNWKTMVPSKLRQATKNNPQFQHISLTFTKLKDEKPSQEDKRLGLAAAGFTPEQAQNFSNFDALLFINFDEPVKMKDGQAYIWNLLISHHILHIVEILTDKRIIDEPPTEHYYESPEALEPFNKFVAWVGLNETIDRYVPCK